MYISVPIIFMIAWITGVSWFAGGCMAGSKGAWAGLLIGLIGSCIVVDQVQRLEISATQYSIASRMIEDDCRLAGYGRTILADKRISAREYWRLQDLSEAVELGDARSKINGETMRQCTTTA